MLARARSCPLHSAEAVPQKCLSARALYFCPVIIRKAAQEELGDYRTNSTKLEETRFWQVCCNLLL